MPRTPREKSPTGIYHIIMRGVNRQRIFEDHEDRQKLLEKLFKFRGVSGYRIFAYCLMDNHIHILIQENKEPLSRAMKRLSSSYVMYFNHKYERVGHLFQERYRSEVVDNDRYLLTALRYIHQNPLKAKMVEDVTSYRWSSYNEYLNDGYLVDKEFVLELFGPSREKALAQFIAFHGEINDDKCIEIEEPRMNDGRLKEIIRDRIGMDASDIENEDKMRQISILRKLKTIDGINTRQLSRLTGIPYIRVWRA
ncbi:MAG: transposase [Desulfitobacterium hafniense]